MSSLSEQKEHTFDAYCTRLLKHAMIDILREYERQNQREVTFSDLSAEEMGQLHYIDTYAPDRRVFRLLEMDVEIADEDLGRALEALSADRRAIVLLAYLLDMPDAEIAQRLNLNRSTVQYRRTSTLEQLRKMMEEYDHE